MGYIQGWLTWSIEEKKFLILKKIKKIKEIKQFAVTKSQKETSRLLRSMERTTHKEYP